MSDGTALQEWMTDNHIITLSVTIDWDHGFNATIYRVTSIETEAPPEANGHGDTPEDALNAALTTWHKQVQTAPRTGIRIVEEDGITSIILPDADPAQEGE